MELAAAGDLTVPLTRTFASRLARYASAPRGSRNGGDSGAGLPIIIYLRW